ncbi:hypothetical protein KS4_06230 [Poriferisphaera corsica]|uniref:Uncharacterized protein n=1 Tax=Poriferisphaera corsica TaxID=2528020 RepID=A0A517YQT1_9BACT|nr:hypothetical protein [Poriferisphaera corsica]QDU32589.1 hypothetical protein KS4_06230 [Poriferisphaera corsica]
MKDKQDKTGCCREETMCFADGEACEEVRMRVLGRMAEDSDVVRQVMHQSKLKEGVTDAMGLDAAYECPADLKAKLTGMFEDAATVEQVGASLSSGGQQNIEQEINDRPAVVGRIGKWLPTAVAAGLLLAATVVFNSYVGGGSGDGASVAGLLPSRMVNLFEKRHVSCSKELAQLPQDPKLPSKIEALPGALNDRFGASTSGLDLSGIGYVFDRVGKCTVPGEISVHLIYKPVDGSGHTDSISLWLSPDDGRLEAEPNQIYTINDASKAHPILMWKNGGMVYYLVGDSMEVTRQAVESLRKQGDR